MIASTIPLNTQPQPMRLPLLPGSGGCIGVGLRGPSGLFGLPKSPSSIRFTLFRLCRGRSPCLPCAYARMFGLREKRAGTGTCPYNSLYALSQRHKNRRAPTHNPLNLAGGSPISTIDTLAGWESCKQKGIAILPIPYSLFPIPYNASSTNHAKTIGLLS